MCVCVCVCVCVYDAQNSEAAISTADMFDTYAASEQAQMVRGNHNYDPQLNLSVYMCVLADEESGASLEELTSRAASRLATASVQPSRPNTAFDFSTAIPGRVWPLQCQYLQ